MQRHAIKGNKSIGGPILSLFHQVDFITRQVIWVSKMTIYNYRLVLSDVFCPSLVSSLQVVGPPPSTFDYHYPSPFHRHMSVESSAAVAILSIVPSRALPFPISAAVHIDRKVSLSARNQLGLDRSRS